MNIVIAGVGGQGVVTLKRILSYAFVKEDLFFRASELHGLSQRGGSVLVHVRYGTHEIHSPTVGKGGADLIIGLDLLEAARAIEFASKDSVYVVNDRFISFYQLPKFTRTEFEKVTRSVTKRTHVADATTICKEKLGSTVFESVFLLGFAFAENALPIKEESLIFGIQKSVPQKYTKENIEAFNLGKSAV